MKLSELLIKMDNQYHETTEQGGRTLVLFRNKKGQYDDKQIYCMECARLEEDGFKFDCWYCHQELEETLQYFIRRSCIKK